ncbi:MAG TPA: DUF3943 domain-containing protein [Candidatus Kapabacteria bacterium]|nr:DUF3943 domain-containing protein [Candidatus Kapabacteria bacterium]
MVPRISAVLLGLIISCSFASSAFAQSLPDTSAAAKVMDILPPWQFTVPALLPERDLNSTVNEIGSLFSDNPLYYGRAPIWLPLVKITLSNSALFAIDRYVFNYDFSHISLASWKNNLKEGWTWRDTDRFANDFFFHPYSGGGYFMDARSLGYNYWESIPFAVFGSAEWKYFCENDQPSYPDLINTSVNGPFVGEIAYRVTSNILNDSKTGIDRVWRETVVGLLSPSRFFSRLITGKLWEVAPEQELEREPWDVQLSVDAHRVNNGSTFWSGPIKAGLNLAVEYGDPFEIRDRKPFDQFKVWTEFTNAYERKYLGEVTGYGELFAGNTESGNFQMLYGLFQHFDYFDNLTFELGDVSFGPGIITKLKLTEHHNLYSTLHASFIPFGANNAGFFPNPTTDSIDYSYGDGFEGMTETGLDIGDHFLDLSFIGYYVYFHSYYGRIVDNSMLLLKPRLVVHFTPNFGVGLEQQIYQSDRLQSSFASASLVRTEQRLFVQWTWDDFSKE